MTETLIAEAPLRQFTRAAFNAAGFSDDDAVLATDVLVWASLRGVDTHGIRNLKRYYVDSIGGVGQRDGVILQQAELTTDQESETTVALNANGGLGLSASVRAMRKAIEKASDHGIGIATVRNSTHFGAAGYYAHMAIEHDMIGFASTGYIFPLGQAKAVVPFGGLLPMLSTNPIAMACPSDREAPFVLDVATSVVPVNRVEMAEELGRALPLAWALDKEHAPTDVPADAAKMRPLGGSRESGGHKGYGLGLAAWILSGLISGAWRTSPQRDRILGENKGTKYDYAQEGVGHCFAAIRLDYFGDPQLIKTGLDVMIRTLNESPAESGVERVMSPGQPEQETERTRRREGIPLSPSTLVDLRTIAEKYEIPLELMT